MGALQRPKAYLRPMLADTSDRYEQAHCPKCPDGRGKPGWVVAEETYVNCDPGLR
jgi:hypothetical protein